MTGSVVGQGRGDAVLVSLLVASLVVWIGAALFFSAVVLPLLFTSLESAEAGRIAALLFPAYFRVGLAAGLLACAAAALRMRRGGRRWQVVFVVLLAMTLAQAWSTLVVHPEMAAIRGLDESVERFQQLHRLSVRLNGVVLAGGLLLVAASGLLLAPRDDQA